MNAEGGQNNWKNTQKTTLKKYKIISIKSHKTLRYVCLGTAKTEPYLVNMGSVVRLFQQATMTPPTSWNHNMEEHRSV